MKRSIVLSGLILFGSLLFSSCTKQLKDDIKELQQKIDDVSHGLGADEPITPVTVFKDKKGNTITIADTYRFKGSDYNTQSLIKKQNGMYQVNITRFVDVQYSESVDISFNYDPSTKAITSKYCDHDWNDNGEYNSRAYYNYDNFNKGLSFDIDLKKIDITTGDISLDVKINATQEYCSGMADFSVPWAGTTLSTSFSFDGKLKVY